MWRRPVRQTMSCALRSSRQEQRTWQHRTRCLPAGTTAALTSRAANGSASHLPEHSHLCAWRGVVLLDEPTAQLDVRGEAEIFDRLLAATRHCTTILISHRFSTVRHATVFACSSMAGSSNSAPITS